MTQFSDVVLLSVIAEVGGLARPRKVREMIDANREELLRYGTLASRPTTLVTGNGARKNVQEYWLNEEQAPLRIDVPVDGTLIHGTALYAGAAAGQRIS